MAIYATSAQNPWWGASTVEEHIWRTEKDSPKPKETLNTYTLSWKPPTDSRGLEKPTFFQLLESGKIVTKRLILHDIRWPLNDSLSIILQCKLDYLELRLHATSPDYGKALGDVLALSHTLKSLVITGTGALAHNFAWEHFTPGFAANTSLTCLSIGRMNIAAKQTELLATVVTSKPLLNLHFWRITPVVTAPVAASLISLIGAGLVSLNLGGNSLSIPTYQALADALVGSSVHLKRLSLWETGLASSAGVFMPALRRNTTLVTLLLNVNDLNGNSAQLLSNALAGNTTLRHLDLSSCSLDSDDLDTIASGLESNTTLRTLILENNRDITYPSGIVSLLEKNRGLCSIATDRGFQQKGLFEIVDALEQNSMIRSLVLGSKAETFNPFVLTNRGLLLASHPTLLEMQPKVSTGILEHFVAKKHTLARQFANLIGSLLLLFGMRQVRPASGSMAALPFELLVQVIYLATESTFNVTQEQIHALLELISSQHVAIRERLRQKNAQLSLIERERAVIVNGKRTIRLQLDVWPPLS